MRKGHRQFQSYPKTYERVSNQLPSKVAWSLSWFTLIHSKGIPDYQLTHCFLGCHWNSFYVPVFLAPKLSLSYFANHRLESYENGLIVRGSVSFLVIGLGKVASSSPYLTIRDSIQSAVDYTFRFMHYPRLKIWQWFLAIFAVLRYYIALCLFKTVEKLIGWMFFRCCPLPQKCVQRNNLYLKTRGSKNVY